MIRLMLGKYVKCKKERAMSESPFMGDLLKERVKIGEKPFSNTGVDYFKPYLVKIKEKQDQLKLQLNVTD